MGTPALDAHTGLGVTVTHGHSWYPARAQQALPDGPEVPGLCPGAEKVAAHTPVLSSTVLGAGGQRPEWEGPDLSWGLEYLDQQIPGKSKHPGKRLMINSAFQVNSTSTLLSLFPSGCGRNALGSDSSETLELGTHISSGSAVEDGEAPSMCSLTR